MSLPWMKTKPQTGVITAITREPDETKEESGDDGLKSCAKDLMSAISSGDEGAAASALRAAFQILDSEPREEGPHTNDESYDSLNAKAAE